MLTFHSAEAICIQDLSRFQPQEKTKKTLSITTLTSFTVVRTCEELMVGYPLTIIKQLVLNLPSTKASWGSKKRQKTEQPQEAVHTLASHRAFLFW